MGGIGLIVLSLWVAVMAYRERRRWLLTWAGVYFTVALTMTTLTYSKGPAPPMSGSLQRHPALDYHHCAQPPEHLHMGG